MCATWPFICHCFIFQCGVVGSIPASCFSKLGAPLLHQVYSVHKSIQSQIPTKKFSSALLPKAVFELQPSSLLRCMLKHIQNSSATYILGERNLEFHC
ncbi:hypothetical protein L6164_006699 [Bauhinia variegata]|uniref:Uncharacterized protein n=1 Tax=Bauhinia variegata TaxID=167791 RepID=A0ACB9PWR3_BAUVA|nr:hypothetical protein L6164_006699 [Bauhinia variegata]